MSSSRNNILFYIITHTQQYFSREIKKHQNISCSGRDGGGQQMTKEWREEETAAEIAGEDNEAKM